MSRKLIVEIIGDDKSVQRAFNRSTQSANRFGVAIANVERKATGAQGILAGRGSAAGFAGAAAAGVTLRFLNQSADAASALEEQVSKSRVVLGQASKTVENFGRSSAEAFGISNRAAVEAASTLAGLFTTIGVGQQRAADLGVELTGLAGDLASFFDTTTDEALGALRSGLVGEAEPLRRFNVLLSESRVQQEAFAQTGKTTAASLTNQEKAFARIAIILRDSADAQGDAERTSESLANKQRRLNAQLEDSRAKIGKLVVPIKTQLIGALSDAATTVDTLVTSLQFLSKVKIPPIKIPLVTDFTGGSLQDLFGGDFKKIFGPRSISDLKEIGDLIADQTTGALNRAIEEVNKKFLRGSFLQIPEIIDDPAPERKRAAAADKSTTAVDALSAAVAGLSLATATATIKANLHAKALEKLQRASDVASLAVDRVGLALDRASGTPTLTDDIAALRQRGAALAAQEKAILAQISLKKNDLDLQRELVGVQSQQIANENQLATTIATRAANSREAAAALLQLSVDQASLALDRAGATATLADDVKAMQGILAALNAQEKAIRAQLALHPKNLDLQRELLDVQRAQVGQEQALAAAVAQRIANQKAAAKSATQAAQFRALGLSPEGEKPIPTIGNLTKQLNQLDTKVAGGKNQRLLNAIRKVLTDPVHKATEETRQAIRDMFATIRGELDDGLKGPLTKGSSLNVSQVLAGLGLTPEAESVARARLSRFNTSGVGAIPVGAPASASAAGTPIVVHTTVELDGKQVGQSTKRFLQNDRRHNPPSRR